MPVKWGQAIKVHGLVSLQIGVSLDKEATYILSVPEQGEEAWLNAFDGDLQRTTGWQAPEGPARTQQMYLQRQAEVHEAGL